MITMIRMQNTSDFQRKHSSTRMAMMMQKHIHTGSSMATRIPATRAAR